MTSRRAPGPWDQRLTITAEIIDAVAPVRSLLPDSRILYLQFQLPKSSDNQNIFFVGGGAVILAPFHMVANQLIGVIYTLYLSSLV